MSKALKRRDTESLKEDRIRAFKRKKRKTHVPTSFKGLALVKMDEIPVPVIDYEELERQRVATHAARIERQLNNDRANARRVAIEAQAMRDKYADLIEPQREAA